MPDRITERVFKVQLEDPPHSGPRLSELFLFLLLGPLIGLTLLGVTAHRLVDTFVGLQALFSPLVFLCFIFGFPSAFLTGLAWQIASTPYAGTLPSRRIRFVATISTGGVCGVLVMKEMGDTTNWWSYGLHGVLSATVCSFIVEAMRAKASVEHQRLSNGKSQKI